MSVGRLVMELFREPRRRFGLSSSATDWASECPESVTIVTDRLDFIVTCTIIARVMQLICSRSLRAIFGHLLPARHGRGGPICHQDNDACGEISQADRLGDTAARKAAKRAAAYIPDVWY